MFFGVLVVSIIGNVVVVVVLVLLGSSVSVLQGSVMVVLVGVDEQVVYDMVFKVFCVGDYVNVLCGFCDFIQQYLDSLFVFNVWYWLGEFYYVIINYVVVFEVFQCLLNQFLQSDKVFDVLFKVGYMQFELKKIGEVQFMLQDVICKYFGFKVVSLVQECLNWIQLQMVN